MFVLRCIMINITPSSVIEPLDTLKSKTMERQRMIISTSRFALDNVLLSVTLYFLREKRGLRPAVDYER